MAPKGFVENPGGEHVLKLLRNIKNYSFPRASKVSPGSPGVKNVLEILRETMLNAVPPVLKGSGALGEESLRQTAEY